MKTNTPRVSFAVKSADTMRLAGSEPDPLEGMPIHRFSQTSLRALDAVEDTSRRIEDLAKRLGCLGHFDRSDGPRAA
jgi:hypothetical protein